MPRPGAIILVLTLLLIGLVYAYLRQMESYTDLKYMTLLDNDDSMVKAALAYDHETNRNDTTGMEKMTYFQSLSIRGHPCVRFAPKYGVRDGAAIYCFKSDKNLKVIWIDEEAFLPTPLEGFTDGNESGLN